MLPNKTYFKKVFFTIFLKMYFKNTYLRTATLKNSELNIDFALFTIKIRLSPWLFLAKRQDKL